MGLLFHPIMIDYCKHGQCLCLNSLEGDFRWQKIIIAVVGTITWIKRMDVIPMIKKVVVKTMNVVVTTDVAVTMITTKNKS